MCRYQKCCCCISAKTGVKIVAILSIIASICGLLLCLFWIVQVSGGPEVRLEQIERFLQKYDNDSALIFQTITQWISVGILLLELFNLLKASGLFHGTHRKVPCLLLFWLVFDMIALLELTLFVIGIGVCLLCLWIIPRQDIERFIVQQICDGVSNDQDRRSCRSQAGHYGPNATLIGVVVLVIGIVLLAFGFHIWCVVRSVYQDMKDERRRQEMTEMKTYHVAPHDYSQYSRHQHQRNSRV